MIIGTTVQTKSRCQDIGECTRGHDGKAETPVRRAESDPKTVRAVARRPRNQNGLDSDNARAGEHRNPFAQVTDATRRLARTGLNISSVSHARGTDGRITTIIRSLVTVADPPYFPFAFYSLPYSLCECECVICCRFLLSSRARTRFFISPAPRVGRSRRDRFSPPDTAHACVLTRVDDLLGREWRVCVPTSSAALCTAVQQWYTARSRVVGVCAPAAAAAESVLMCDPRALRRVKKVSVLATAVPLR